MTKKKLLRMFSLVTIICLLLGIVYFADTNGSALQANPEVQPLTEEKHIAKVNDTILEPPSNFDSLNASDQDPEKYEFPKRPKDEKDLEHWKEIMKNVKQYIKPQQVVDPDTFHSTSTTYSAKQLIMLYHLSG